MFFFSLYLSIILKIRDIYSLDCEYYDKLFGYVYELVDDVKMSGMDPNYEITKNGIGTGEMVIDLIQF